MSRSKTIVLTGATSGIGAGVADAFREHGAKLFLVGRNARKVRAAARRIPDAQLAGTGIADLGSARDIEALVDAVKKRLRGIDVLVLAAGEYGWTELGVPDGEQFESLFRVNVKAPYLLAQGLLPLLEKARGQILWINSSVVRSSGEGVAGFKATQHALVGLADSLRQDLNKRGIRVSSIFPGRTATPRMRRIYARAGADYEPQALLRPRDIGALAVALTRLPAFMEITDVHARSLLRY